MRANSFTERCWVLLAVAPLLLSGCNSTPAPSTAENNAPVPTVAADAVEPAATTGAPTGMASSSGEMVFSGRCDGSAAVFAPGGKYVVVASDEASQDTGENQLAVYSIAQSGGTTATFALNAALQVPKKSKEADLEAAAAIRDRVYWIASHSRNKDGKERPARHQLFATTFPSGSDGAVTNYKTVGVYHDLLEDLHAQPEVKALLKDGAAKSPEAEGGFNIEGMAATPNGGLLVGLRNPVPGGKALLIPVTNPGEVVESGAKAKVGAPILLDLSEGGKFSDRGVRDVVYLPGSKSYLVLAGSWRGFDDSKAAPFALYQWSGKPTDVPKKLSIDLSGLNPEVVTVAPDQEKRILILSDDGNVDDCKDKPDAERRFRGVWRDLP